MVVGCDDQRASEPVTTALRSPHDPVARAAHRRLARHVRHAAALHADRRQDPARADAEDEPVVERDSPGDPARLDDECDAVRRTHPVHRFPIPSSTASSSRTAMATFARYRWGRLRSATFTMRSSRSPGDGASRFASERRLQECPVITPFAKTGRTRATTAPAVGAVLASAAPHRARVPDVPRTLPWQVQPRALLLGLLRPRGVALQRPARSLAQGNGRPRRVRRRGDIARILAGGPVDGRDRSDDSTRTPCLHPPPALPGQRVRPDGASFFSPTMQEFVLPYEEVRRSPDPATAILDFAQSTYDAGATLAGWDREALAYP